MWLLVWPLWRNMGCLSLASSAVSWGWKPPSAFTTGRIILRSTQAHIFSKTSKVCRVPEDDLPQRASHKCGFLGRELLRKLLLQVGRRTRCLETDIWRNHCEYGCPVHSYCKWGLCQCNTGDLPKTSVKHHPIHVKVRVCKKTGEVMQKVLWGRIQKYKIQYNTKYKNMKNSWNSEKY